MKKPSDKYINEAQETLLPWEAGSVVVRPEVWREIMAELDESAQPSPSEPFIPEEGQKYWAWVEGVAKIYTWDNDSGDQASLAEGNVHRTKEEAEAYGAWLQSPVTQARRRIEMLPGYDLCGPNFIFYDYVDNELIQWRSTDTNYGGAGFKTAEQRDYAMQHHEADLMMVLRGSDNG